MSDGTPADPEHLLAADETGFFAGLAALPHSYDGPDGVQSDPYGLLAYGEASSLPGLLASWVDAPLVVAGTQFLAAGGFDYGDAAPMKLGAELGGARVIVLGYGVHAPELPVPPHTFSTYTYAGYLAHATGHRDAWDEANRVMYDLAARLGPSVPTAENPAKTLAWQLWNRVPLLVASRRFAGLANALQRVLARVGKALAIAVPEHPLELLGGAFETRHQLGDDVVGLLVGPEDDELALAAELLESRVAQVERLALPFGSQLPPPEDAAAHGLALWYAAHYVAGYLALLSDQLPEDTEVYAALRATVLEPQDPDAVPLLPEE